MRYAFRLGLFKLLAMLPRPMGDWLYHAAQQARGTLSRQSIYNGIVAQVAFLKTMQDTLVAHGIKTTGGRYLELGSGWYPTLPYECIFKLGASDVFTYDINHHFSRKSIRLFTKKYREINGYPHLSTDGILPNNIHYLPNTDITINPPEKGSIDIAFSRFVLEHIEPSTIESIHRCSKKWIRPDGCWFHIVSPSDHRSFSDRRLKLHSFLQYSNAEWLKKQTRFDYHHRLRLPQYIEIFERAGWKVNRCSYSASATNVADVSSLKIAAEYSHFTPEQLAAGTLVFMLTNA